MSSSRHQYRGLLALLAAGGRLPVLVLGVHLARRAARLHSRGSHQDTRWTHVYLDTAAPQTRVAHHHHALPGLGPGGVAELAPGHHSRLVVE